MILDVTGIGITPSKKGVDCIGNGKYKDKNGNYIECCCDECDYFIYCFEEYINKNYHIKF